MRLRTVAQLLALALALLPAGPVEAQPDWRWLRRAGEQFMRGFGVAPPHESPGSRPGAMDPAALLRSRGFVLLGPLIHRGNTVIADVASPAGRLRIVLHQRTGAIIGAQRLPSKR